MAQTTFGSRVRSLREAAGLTRDELARKAGLTYAAIYSIETGRSKQPEFATREAIAAALDMPLNELWGASPESEESADKARAYSVFQRLQALGIRPCELTEVLEKLSPHQRTTLIDFARMIGRQSG